MYLPEEKRAAIRKCLNNQKSRPGAENSHQRKGCHDSKDSRKIAQILFDARDGKEVFTPF